MNADVGRIGVGICYDIRFQELAVLYAARGLILHHDDDSLSLCFPFCTDAF